MRSRSVPVSFVPGVRVIRHTLSLEALAGMIPKPTLSLSAGPTTENSTESESKRSQRSTPQSSGGSKE